MFSMKKRTLLFLAFFVCFSFFIFSCGGDSQNNRQVNGPGMEVDVQITYEYDDLNRVTKAVYSNGSTVTYNYDDAGNITRKIVE